MPQEEHVDLPQVVVHFPLERLDVDERDRPFDEARLPRLDEPPQTIAVVSDNRTHLDVVPEVVSRDLLGEVFRERSPVAILSPFQFQGTER